MQKFPVMQKIIKFIFGLLIFAFIFQSNISAQEKSRLEVKVGVYVIGISKLSTQTSSYSMDFYLSLTCNRACEQEKDFKFEIINGQITNNRLTDNQPNYKVFRINADLVSNFDFRMYPFEKPQLTLIIEDESFDTSEIIYSADTETTAIDEQMPNFGWQIDKVETKTSDHFYPNFKKSYSSYKFTITLSRPFWSSILMLLPALAIMLATFIGIIMSPFIEERGLSLIASSLVGSVFLHTSLAAGVPQVPYLTYADRFMLINFFITTVSLLAIVLMQLKTPHQDEKSRALHRKICIALPILWVVLLVVNSFI